MPATPSRGSLKPDRTRQGSSLHPVVGASSSTATSAPYPPVRRGPGLGSGSGVQSHAPFIHPALASSTTAAPSIPASSRGRKPFNHRNLFSKDLRNLMYAYGDVANPDPDSVALLEEMTVEFITDLCCRARPSPYALGLGSTVAESIDALPPRPTHRQRVKLEDFRHAMRKDVEAKKLGRMEQLLYADRIVTEARKVGGVEEVAEKAGALNVPDAPSNGGGNQQAQPGNETDEIAEGSGFGMDNKAKSRARGAKSTKSAAKPKPKKPSAAPAAI
ncbi:hypothetical protein ACQY0O_004045 [Thecaphora frezii]